MTHLHRDIQAFNDLTAARNAVIDGREAVEHGPLRLDGFQNAVFRLFIAVLAGVAVNGGGQQVSLALVLQIGQKLDVLFNQSDAGAGLNQGLPLFLGCFELARKILALGHLLVVVKGLLQIDVLACRPLAQDLFPQFAEFVVRDAFVLYFHRI